MPVRKYADRVEQVMPSDSSIEAGTEGFAVPNASLNPINVSDRSPGASGSRAELVWVGDSAASMELQR